jgi:hypothetical protein
MTEEPTIRDPDDGDDDVVAIPAAVNLTLLDPVREGARFDALARSIASEAMSIRAAGATGPGRADSRRRVPREAGALALMVAWSRPALIAASVILAVAIATLVAVPAPAAAAPTSLAESAGIPAPLVEWSTTARKPNAAELIGTFDSLTVVRVAARQ